MRIMLHARATISDVAGMPPWCGRAYPMKHSLSAQLGGNACLYHLRTLGLPHGQSRSGWRKSTPLRYGKDVLYPVHTTTTSASHSSPLQNLIVLPEMDSTFGQTMDRTCPFPIAVHSRAFLVTYVPWSPWTKPRSDPLVALIAFFESVAIIDPGLPPSCQNSWRMSPKGAGGIIDCTRDVVFVSRYSCTGCSFSLKMSSNSS
mmetsp:Transcript_26066/g.85676  ORF Transcript_26066/g.85676 Transcript_26066/m.85676 type:complete len:202 (-) Transcript_26066:724-1329(-)